jgi:hypothetical protein
MVSFADMLKDRTSIANCSTPTINREDYGFTCSANHLELSTRLNKGY